MAYATETPAMSEMNTTPLIDVMLVLLIMFIITIPVATHSVDIDLPSGKPPPAPLPLEPTVNKLIVTTDGQTLWNGTPVEHQQLALTLAAARDSVPEPELQFEPEPMASYDMTARTLQLIEAVGVTKFGFVGNEKYRQFSSGE